MARRLPRLALCLLALAITGARGEESQACDCNDGTVYITKIVVEMPPAVSSSAIVPTPAPVALEEIPLPTPSAGTNTTSTFGPVTAPDVDYHNIVNVVPQNNVSLYYGSPKIEEPGLINMTLAMNTPAVVLEYVSSITNVDCDDSGLTVSFNNSAMFAKAATEWESLDNFVLITNHMGDCDAEFERGFFLATKVSSDQVNQKIAVEAAKQDIANIAGSCEMIFDSMPAASLKKRLTWNPSNSISFSDSLKNDTVLYSDGQYFSLVADEAYFTSTTRFSGYLNYNFWGFKLESLYFDIDTYFDAELELSANVQAAYSKNFTYAPNELSYSLVDVPGIISLGPGIAFAIGVDLGASASVGLKTGLGVTLPDGNVHVDLLDNSKTSTSGWTPSYHTYANITEAANLTLDARADITVELAINLLGGLLDLSSGLTASPGFNNVFTLQGTQDLAADSNGTSVNLPGTAGQCSAENGLELKTDFVFEVTAFATQWWSQKLYNVTVPLWDYCYKF